MSHENRPTARDDRMPRLSARFADEFPEMSVEWTAREASSPELIVLNEDLAAELGLDADWLRTPAGVSYLLGHAAAPATDRAETGPAANRADHAADRAETDAAAAPYRPVAQAYSGHQFGTFVPILGDGRALLLGEITDRHGNLRDIHLKGSGATPFARRGDGLAALGPMLREHLTGEFMHAAGIPTTRALAVIATGDRVQRERALPGAVLVRVAASHLRVGSFQFARTHGDDELVARLVDHAAGRHYPHLLDLAAEDRALALFDAVATAQARLVADWMGVGFIHGVMNTDNIAISGEAIDYGPCAFLDAHDPAAFFSYVDRQGIYAYGNQPRVLEWDLARFSETLLPLYDADADRALALAREHLSGFPLLFDAHSTGVMAAKLGFAVPADDDGRPGAIDAPLRETIIEWLAMLAEAKPDHTLVHRALTRAAEGTAGTDTRSGANDGGGTGPSGDTAAVAELLGHFPDTARAKAWLGSWRKLGPDPDVMGRANPIYVPRNHLVEEALAAAGSGGANEPRDMGPFHELLARISAPFTPADSPGHDRYRHPDPGGLDGYMTFCGT